MATEGHVGWQVNDRHPTGMLSCFISIKTATLLTKQIAPYKIELLILTTRGTLKRCQVLPGKLMVFIYIYLDHFHLAKYCGLFVGLNKLEDEE